MNHERLRSLCDLYGNCELMAAPGVGEIEERFINSATATLSECPVCDAAIWIPVDPLAVFPQQIGKRFIFTCHSCYHSRVRFYNREAEMRLVRDVITAANKRRRTAVTLENESVRDADCGQGEGR